MNRRLVDPACWNCDYWHSNSNDSPGDCRRYPPTVVPVHPSDRTPFVNGWGVTNPNEFDSKWPGTEPEEHCGEWRRIDPKANRKKVK